MERLAEKLNGCEAAVEASTSGIFVYEYLSSRNLKVEMSNPHKMRLIAESEKKTDRTDAEVLADLLRTGMLPTCYVPPKEIRELRDIVRHRKVLVETVTVLKNKIRAILRREGVKCPFRDVLGKDAMKWLSEVEVSPIQKDAILKLLVTADLIEKDVIGDYGRRIYAAFQFNEQAKILDTIPGISYLSAITILAEIGDIKRFPSDEELASYAGLAPRIYQSGEVRRDKGLKHGDKILKSILIQDAHTTIKCSKRFRKYYLKKKRKRGHQKAIVAVARKMVEVIYHMLTRGETYQENYT